MACGKPCLAGRVLAGTVPGSFAFLRSHGSHQSVRTACRSAVRVMSVEFVAEVSSNHHRDLSRCLAFIDQAAAIGSSAVKFQLFRMDEIFAPEAFAHNPELRRLADWELPVEFLPALAERCRARGVRFGCTPFYLDAVDTLAPHVDFLKIASYELLWS